MAVLLNEMLANTLDLYSHAKQAHWNVRGPQFQEVHELFDRVATASLEIVDEVAERAGQLGASVAGTIHDASRASALPRYELQIAATDAHLRAVAWSMQAYCAANLKAIKKAEDAEDQLTLDLFVEGGRRLEELLWFVESHVVPATPHLVGQPKAARSAKAGAR